MKNKVFILIIVLSLILSGCGSNKEKEKDIHHNQEQAIPLFKLDKGENLKI